MRNRKGQLRRELQKICATNGGLLRPADVVEFARDPTTALHTRFEWDDTVAPWAYRLIQAQDIIRHVKVTIPKRTGGMAKVRVFVNLGNERTSDSPGYRMLSTVQKSKERYAQMLTDAQAELQAFQHKFVALQGLPFGRAALTAINAAWKALEKAKEEHVA